MDYLEIEHNAVNTVQSGRNTIEEVIDGRSTSQQIVIALALERWDLLPEPYRDPNEAWARLNEPQRNFVRVILNPPKAKP